VSIAADVLGVVRLLLAGAFVVALVRAAEAGARQWTPLVLYAVAATSDFLDGRLARRASRPTRHGAVLDTVADVVFVLAATGAAAALGTVPWAVPVAIAVAVGGYGVASARLSARWGGIVLARSRVGHAAGVCNYVLVGLVGVAAAVPLPVWDLVLELGSLAVVGVNLAGGLEHLLAAGLRPTAPRSRT
jgi:phosphatidylglycerophosphate synthase